MKIWCRALSSFSLVLAAALTMASAGCDRRERLEAQARAATGGDPEHGRLVMRQYGCDTCHTIAGVEGANALVGPPLQSFAKRAYVAGVLPNSPPNLERWLMHPRGVLPTAMPEMGVTESDARDMAAYLYTLE